MGVAGEVVAASDRPLLLDETGLPTRYYLPADDVRATLAPTSFSTTCPFKGKAVAAKLLSLRALRRTYRPKATIEIRVIKAKKIGKYTRIRTRRGKAPVRVDRCLMPAKTNSVRCPGG